jgi:DNA segregation ATPase FtsK/SpoIIIE-like protein
MNKIEYRLAAIVLAATLGTGAFVPEAHALRGRGAAFVVGASVGAAGSATADANAAAAQQQAATAQQQAEVEKQKAITAQQQAEAEKQKAVAAQQQAAQAGAAGKPLPAGTVVAKLPPGCTPTPVGGKNYQYCGGTFYEPVYEGSTLKYVTTTPK